MELVVLIGLPASGKTTFYRERFSATHAHVSKDLHAGGGRRDEGQRREIDEALRAGRSVVVDNTNPRAADRAPLVALARAHGARVAGFVFDVDASGSLARNALREGRARVPPVAIHVARRRLELPTAAEGFDELWSVRLVPGGGFEVQPLDATLSPTR
jgi:predicted kinase